MTLLEVVGVSLPLGKVLPFWVGLITSREPAHAYRFVNLNIKDTQRKEQACLCLAGGKCKLLISQ